MSALAHPLASVEEYFALEDASPDRHEYYRGRILAMAGGTYDHGAIGANVIGELRLALKGKACQVVTSDVRLAASTGTHYTYTDAMVVCGKPVYAGQRRDTVLNPTVVVEVLSPSTERSDRGRKLTDYQKLDSLREYLLVSQIEPRAESYRRQPDGTWAYREWRGLEATVTLESVDAQLRMSEIYEKIEFEPDLD